MEKSFKSVLGLAACLVLLALVWNWARPETVPLGQVVCTQEAKQCPDGSYVGRTGPSCEFAACGGTPVDSSWKVGTSTPLGTTFQYPADLATLYIHSVDWPPVLRVLPQTYSCTEAGAAAIPGGKTEKRVVGGRTYCVTTEAEGAAGTTYLQYAYAFPLAQKTAIFTFTIREVQCDNYDDPQKTACHTERDAFSVDSLVDRMAQSVK